MIVPAIHCPGGGRGRGQKLEDKAGKSVYKAPLEERIMEFDQVFDGNEIPVKPPAEDALAGMEEHMKSAENTKTEASPAEDELAKLRTENAELQDKYLRSQADYQNYRKRMSKDMAAMRNFAVIETVTPFIQLFDNFSMAVQAAKKSDNLDAIVKGLSMIDDQYKKSLDELNITRFDAVNAKFDHNLHEAVASENSDTVPEGVVIRQWNCGYKLGDQLLRPARVVVSAGPGEKKAQ